MTLWLERPAPWEEVRWMIAQDHLPLAVRKFGLTPATLARRYVEHLSWGMWDQHGLCVATAGLFPLPATETSPRRYEGWFACWPTAAEHTLAIVRLAQLTYRAVAQDGPIEIIAHVAVGHRPGARLARMIGFTPGPIEAGYETWIWRGAAA